MARQISLTVGGTPGSIGTTLTQSKTDNVGLTDSFSLDLIHPGAVYGAPAVNSLYYGQTIGPGVTLSARESFYGQRIGIYHDYFNMGTTSRASAITFCSTQLGAGRVPLFSMKMNGTGLPTGTGAPLTSGGAPVITWRDVTNGLLDTQFNSMFSQLDALAAGPILFAPHSEPNGDEGDYGPTVADYKAMCIHLMSLLAPYPQILLVPILAAGPSNMSGGLNFANWMSAASCHVPGFNTYNHLSYNPDNSGIPPSTTQAHNYSTVSQCLDRQIASLRAACGADSRWIVGEWGTRTVTATANDPAAPGVAAQWMADFYNTARLNGAYGICYFDSNANVNDQGSPWTLSDTTDTSDGTERYNEHRTLLRSATSQLIPVGGLAA